MSRSPIDSPPSPHDHPQQRHVPLSRHNRSDFDLEPNPFEQSFSATPNSNVRTNNPSSPPRPSSTTRDPKRDSARSPSPANSNDSHRSTSQNNRSTSPRPVLPPLASISSPQDPYPWSFPANALGNSLRSGPLSPAMLPGPQQSASDQNHLQFDPTSFRTGLTPRSGLTPRTGLTPGTGLTPLVASTAPFPPSPNTAAFLALMNSNNAAAPSSGVTITPNTLNTISGMLNNSSSTQHHYQPSNPHHSRSHHPSHENGAPYAPNASNTANPPANGLFLLSQAHQELTKREAQARAGANGISSNAPSANMTNGTTNGRRSTRRKSYDIPNSPPTPPQTRGGKRARTDTSRVSRRSLTAEMQGSEDDDDDDEVMADDTRDINHNSGSNRRTPKKPETEEEKRKNFLERNRQAALKCRQRKKAWLASLQAKVEFLSNENERLTSALVSSQAEISRLSALVGGAGVGPSASDHVPMTMRSGPAAGQPVSMNVVIPGKGPGVGVTAGGRSGYGY